MRYRSGIVQYRQIDQNSNHLENTSLMIVDIETGDVIMELNKYISDSGLYLVGDNIKIHHKNGMTFIENLSCKVLKVSRLTRNLNSLMRNMTNEHHPLNRVLVKNKFNELCFCLLPDEDKFRHPFLRKPNEDNKSV